MKKIISIGLALVICIAGKAQSVVIVNECKKSIDLPGDITINPTVPGRVILRGVELKCNTLQLDATLSTIQIAGTVKIKCNRINIATLAVGATPNIIVTGNGSLIFEYPAGVFSNNRGFEVDTNTNVKLSFIQNQQ
jgi:hypothetical protein